MVTSMLHITDEMVSAAVRPEQAQRVLREAFLEFGSGKATVQQRVRTQCAGIKLSTLGAVMPERGVAGAKVYTTINGQFGFVILLFSAADGRPLATFEAGALTRIRTAACSVLAARAAVRSSPRVLGLFGLGVQGVEHAKQMTQAFAFERLLVHDPYASQSDLDTRLRGSINIPIERVSPEVIASEADLVVTATRSQTPLFSGHLLRPGAFIAAIGSSLPNTRELDDATLSRARRIIVEWKPQALAEAGDLVLASAGAHVGEKLVELSALLAGTNKEDDPSGITVYKAVGIGLADVALADLAYRQLTEKSP